MAFLLTVLVLGSLVDPSGVIVPVRDTPRGLLCTDGRGTGLYLCAENCEPVTISSAPGAGRNVLVDDGSILFKECSSGEPQRIVLCDLQGNRQEIYSGDYFGGPFSCEGGFLVTAENSVLRCDLEGKVEDEWSITGYPACAALTEEALLYTGESGGLYIQHSANEAPKIIQGSSGQTFRNLMPGGEGMVIAEISPRGFLILQGEEVVRTVQEGMYPEWTEDGSVVFSVLQYDGLFPVSGTVLKMDPVTGETLEVPSRGIPLHPLELRDGRAVWTEAADGSLAGASVKSLPEADSEPGTDDPDAHFDVVYMHQRWDTPDWFNGSWSCGPTSCMMTVQYYRRLTPDSIWASYPSPGHWSLWGNYIPVEYTFLGHTYDDLGESPSGYVPGAHGFICPTGAAWWDLMVDFLTQHEVYSAWGGTAWSTLTGEIDGSYPVVCSSSVLGYGHIILFNGYYDNHTVVTNDPYGDANESGWGDYYNGKDVLYDWPGYNNGHLEIGVSQLFYAQAQVPQQADTLVDDNSTGFFKYSDCRFWHRTGSGYRGNAWWTYSTGAPPDTCIAMWYPELPYSGDYDISVYVPPDRSTATGIYKISTSAGIEEVYLDQALYSDQWAFLGRFNLNGDSYLRLGDYTGTGGQYIAFDAALFSPAGTGTSQEDPGNMIHGLRMRPNPCSQILTVSLPQFCRGGTLELYDTSGRLVSRIVLGEDSEFLEMDVSDLSAGVYMLRVRREGTSASRMLTVIQ
ncbi:MAG: T9SS type A sorting domain-containing protein [Candidatus Aegiribacteria sp.]|nr:T9SS type A sorting domain-containing protein [Candidatus Aegiribacteria sp.]MBD3294980.1 T9SS type A sorting domain-containing protein [Candidatus Fermentibacteria bacterium]